jgi:type I restriction enzyme S subunit
MSFDHHTDLQPCTLGDLCRIKHGFAFKGEFFTDSGDLIVLTPGNFEPDGGIKLKGDKEKFYNGTFPSEFLLVREICLS